METRRGKRQRCGGEEQQQGDGPEAASGSQGEQQQQSDVSQSSPPCTTVVEEVELSLQVKWSSGARGHDDSAHGKTRVTRLMLKPLEDVGKLGGLSKGLMDRAFPADSRPEYLTDDMFYRWTPDETCLSYPLDVTTTEFKLVANYKGWEYVILSHELGNPMELPDRKLFVTVIEFESVAVVLGNLGIRISLVAYPVVCVQKTFLNDVKEQLTHNPEFRGILS
ncbi:hypothetical protein FOA52_002601 [Chlamydomonas sp. UWO 241]|nr:hypothetical protein FOA52_002601 [Chlamydomonas sp. UWO 241]